MSRPARRPTTTVQVDGVPVGSPHPIVVQSMTNTDTANTAATVDQVMALARAGSEIVRVTVNNDAAARAVPEIVERLADSGVNVPIVGDFHYNGHLLLERFPECAGLLAKYRINPGNVGGKRRDENFRAIVEIALANDKPIRIGVNWGSLDRALLTEMMDENSRSAEPVDAREVTANAMVESALRSARFAEEVGLTHDRIVLSAKVSAVQDLLTVYRTLAAQCDYALHLGLTEAGMGAKGIVASTVGMSILLQEGIGDTIRVSLTPNPGGDRTEEVRIAQQMLQSLGLRAFSPQVTACPGCGRTTSTFFQKLAAEIQGYLVDQMPVWKRRHPGVERMKVAVMGCVVNGPGESKHADIGISLPGTARSRRRPFLSMGNWRSRSRVTRSPAGSLRFSTSMLGGTIRRPPLLGPRGSGAVDNLPPLSIVPSAVWITRERTHRNSWAYVILPHVLISCCLTLRRIPQPSSMTCERRVDG